MFTNTTASTSNNLAQIVANMLQTSPSVIHVQDQLRTVKDETILVKMKEQLAVDKVLAGQLQAWLKSEMGPSIAWGPLQTAQASQLVTMWIAERVDDVEALESSIASANRKESDTIGLLSGLQKMLKG